MTPVWLLVCCILVSAVHAVVSVLAEDLLQRWHEARERRRVQRFQPPST